MAFLLLAAVMGRPQAAVDIDNDTYDALAAIHALIEQGDHAQARARLESISKAGLASQYEKALMLQAQGYLHARQGQHLEAITALQASLQLDSLPSAAAHRARLLLIQMQARVDHHADAARNLDAWLAAERLPPPEVNALAGAVYAWVKRLDDAAERLRLAIDQSNEPDERWYRQLAAVHLHAKRYDKAAALLREMVRRFPAQKAHWLQLAGAYLALEQDDEALAMMELAERRGLSFSEAERLRHVRLLLSNGLPYRAATVLEQGLDDGRITPSTKHWELLSTAWYQAREFPRALAAIEKALQIEPSPNLQLRRAEIAAQLEDWEQVQLASREALAGDQPRHAGSALLLLGIAHYHREQWTDAQAAFLQAMTYQASRSQAEHWLEVLSTRIERLPETPVQAITPIGHARAP
jgi:tetratricopeptide (TPR) repeat protein